MPGFDGDASGGLWGEFRVGEGVLGASGHRVSGDKVRRLSLQLCRLGRGRRLGLVVARSASPALRLASRGCPRGDLACVRRGLRSPRLFRVCFGHAGTGVREGCDLRCSGRNPHPCVSTTSVRAMDEQVGAICGHRALPRCSGGRRIRVGCAGHETSPDTTGYVTSEA